MRVWLAAKPNYIQSSTRSIMKHGGGCMVRVKLNPGAKLEEKLVLCSQRHEAGGEDEVRAGQHPQTYGQSLMKLFKLKHRMA